MKKTNDRKVYFLVEEIKLRSFSTSLDSHNLMRATRGAEMHHSGFSQNDLVHHVNSG